MAAKIGINGGKELAEKFKKISKDVENELEQALMTGGLRVERDAKIKVPVDTGRLRSSIATRLTAEGDSRYVEVGTNVKYAPYVEYGTSKQPAQPFLYPAFAENKQKIFNDIAKAFKKGCGL